MNNMGLVDKRAYLNVLGCLLQDPTLLDDVDRPLTKKDFSTEQFYEILFAAIYNLYFQGCNVMDELSVDSYLSNHESLYKIFQANNGLEYLVNARDMAQLENYDYYYHRVRKFALLRYYEESGLDTRNIYDTTLVAELEAEKEHAKFDKYTEQDIVGLVESALVIKPTMYYCSNELTEECLAGDGLDALIDELMEEPDVGLPLNSPAITTITRGARKGCLYMRSCPQGFGKTRMAAADAAKMSIPYYYDVDEHIWVYTGISEPTLYITTEMKNSEIQTIFAAIISGVNESHILYGEYEPGELERVRQANQYIKSSPLYMCHIPDFSISDIKNLMKKYHREFNVDYFFFDYIFSSLRLMNEANSISGMGLKEHQLLLVFSTELKALCQQLDVFMFTASQLSAGAVDAPIKDQNLLAGSKALSNKLDVGYICCPPNKGELKKIDPIIKKQIGMRTPNVATWVYKIRSGRITRVVVWSYYDMGNMRCQDLFVTDHNFELIDVDFTQIEIMPAIEEVLKEHSVLMSEIKEQEVVVDEDTGEIVPEEEKPFEPVRKRKVVF